MKYMMKPTGGYHSSHTPKHEKHSAHAIGEKAEHCIRHTLENPPHTWAAYESMPGGLWKILEMEFGEASAAYKAMKTETGTHHEYVTEISQILAAAAMLYDKMTCEDEHHGHVH